MLFFTGYDTEHGYELWKSDGTTAGTVLFKDIVAGAGASMPTGLTNLKGTLLFFATSPTQDGRRQLWRSDGTPAGTVPLDVDEVGPSGNSTFVTGNTMFFVDGQGRLWKTDGTAEGTVVISDPFTGVSGFGFIGTAVMQNTLYFSASDPQHGFELWKSNGTPGGTMLVRDIVPGKEDSNPTSLVVLNQHVFFIVQPALDTYELWQSDGTEAGTIKVADMCSPGLAAFNGKVFFGASDVEHGCELWQTDGTPGGTRLFKDIAPGAADANPVYITAVGRTLVFSTSANNYYTDGLWVSNGTPEGTAQVGQDVVINDQPLAIIGKQLFFSDGDLWAVVLPETPSYTVFLPLTLR